MACLFLAQDAVAASLSAYIPAYVSANVSVIGLPTSLGPVISTSAGSQGISFTPDGSYVYVTNQTSSDVSKIEVSSNTVVELISVTNAPLGIAVSPDGAFAYVANLFGNNIDVINTSNDTVVASIVACGVPRGIAFTPDGSRAYVTCGLDNTLVVIDVATHSLTGSPIDVGISPIGISISPDGQSAYVTNVGENTVSVVDLETESLSANISVGDQPIGIVVSPDGRRAYVANNNGASVSVINISTNTVLGSEIVVGNGPYGVSITPDGATVYVVNSLDATVTPIDTESLEAGLAVDISAFANNPIGFGNFITPSPVVDLEPEAYTFGDQAVGSSSEPITYLLRNRGNALLEISAISVSGDFSQTNDCGPSLNSAESCNIWVTFTPSAEGLREGSLILTDNVQDFDNAEISASPQTFSLTGMGTAGPLPPPSPGTLQGGCGLQTVKSDFSNQTRMQVTLSLFLLVLFSLARNSAAERRSIFSSLPETREKFRSFPPL